MTGCRGLVPHPTLHRCDPAPLSSRRAFRLPDGQRLPRRPGSADLVARTPPAAWPRCRLLKIPGARCPRLAATQGADCLGK